MQSADPLESRDQDAVIAFLSRPESYGTDVAAVQRIDTHVSIVFLAGDRVYKMKRAVRFAYLDYGTLARRRDCCIAEVAINRRTAPDLYLGAVPVTRAGDGALRLGGEGEAVEWLVEMKRFEQRYLFDRMAEDGLLTAALMSGLADSIARFHADAAAISSRVGSDVMRGVLDVNFIEIDKTGPEFFPPALAQVAFNRSQYCDRLKATCAQLIETCKFTR